MGKQKSMRARRQLRRASSRCVEPLEGRLLLTVTTTVDHSAGFGGATDLTLNGGASITDATDAAAPNSLQITSASNLEARSAFTTGNQGVDTFDTTFTWVYDPAEPPTADGFTFTLQAGAPTAVGYLGYAIGYAGIDAAHPGIQNSIAIKLDLYNGGPTASETGLYANGVGIDQTDSPETSLTTAATPIGTTVDLTKAPDGSSTGINFHTYPNDTYKAHLVYGGGMTISETLTDVTQNISVNQTFDLGGMTVAQIIGSHTAHAGFTGGTGGASAIQDIKSWTYSGTNVTQLGAPVLTGTTTLGGEIVLNYTSPGGQTGFEIDQSIDNGFSFQTVDTVGPNVTQYTLTGLNPQRFYQFKVRALGDNTTTFTSPYSNTVTRIASGTPPTAYGLPSVPGEFDLFFSTPFADRTGFKILESTDNGATFQSIATLPATASNYSVTGLNPTATYILAVQTLGNGTTTFATPPSAPVFAVPQGLPSPTFAGGFAGNVQLNGSATVTPYSATPPNVLQLTDGQTNEAGSAFSYQLQLADSFDTTFDFTFGSTVPPAADGFAFALQTDGPRALGALGYGMGFQGIAHGIGVFFNLYPSASQTGLWLPGGRSQVHDLTAQGLDFHARPGDKYEAHLDYDPGTLNETLTDLNTGVTASVTYDQIFIPQIIGSRAGLVGFTGGTGLASSDQTILDFSYTGRFDSRLVAPVAAAISCAPGVIDVGFSELTPDTGGYEIDQSADLGTTWTPVGTVPAGARYFEATGLDPRTAYEFKVRALGNGHSTSASVFSNVVTAIQQTDAPQPRDFSGGFTATANSALQLNGSAILTGAAPASPTPANALQITPALNLKFGSAFTRTPQLIGNFDTQFDLVSPAGTNPPADGLTFVLQTQSPIALDATTAGGGLGYGPVAVGAGDGSGIRHSVAIKFDIHDNFGEGMDSTGLFVNGDAPTLPDGNVPEETSIDMTSSGLVLGIRPDVYRVHLSYDGTTLHESIADLARNTSFTHDYTIDLTRYLEAGCAYVGFTGATGGLNSEQDILNWKFVGNKNLPAATINGNFADNTITLRKDAADPGKDDVWINAPTTGAPTEQLSNSQTIAINGFGGNDTLVIDSSNGNPIPTGAAGTTLRLNGGTGVFTLGGAFPTLDASRVIDLGTATLIVPHTIALLPAVQAALRSGLITSSDAASSAGRFAIADVDGANQVTLSYRAAGDLNGDGAVNFPDLLTLAQHYGNTGADWSKGDLNYDGTVGFADLLALAQHYGQTAAAASAAVSPPATSDLLTSRTRTSRMARPARLLST